MQECGLTQAKEDECPNSILAFCDDLFQNNKTNKRTKEIMAPAASFVW